MCWNTADTPRIPKLHDFTICKISLCIIQLWGLEVREPYVLSAWSFYFKQVTTTCCGGNDYLHKKYCSKGLVRVPDLLSCSGEKSSHNIYCSSVLNHLPMHVSFLYTFVTSFGKWGVQKWELVLSLNFHGKLYCQ